jgi:hypothetical protein
MLRLRRRRSGTWQVWTLNGDGRWAPIGAPRFTLDDAARLARVLAAGREVAICPAGARPIASV